ncbi:growth-regulating factor 10-like isoform X2 [Camellia sinensis]|uniref:growth-regulating factor 10-like isoform X2 n=1 Tax=Camellia sinensis TaxID=4442 RepID=UPI001035AABD|nr:growth-regulating factor 10-like isoform X2 [Camellia sinensis]
MEPQNPPPKIARLADNVPINHILAILTNCLATSRTSCREVSPPTGLGLGLELGHHRSSNRHGCSKSSGFTFLQLQELEQQALIYNYIEAGLAVPRHLVLPIWKSFAGYLSSVNGACLQQQYFANYLFVAQAKITSSTMEWVMTEILQNSKTLVKA